MKADFAKHFTGGALRNLKKVKTRRVKYDENSITFTLKSKIDKHDLGKFECVYDIRYNGHCDYSFCIMRSINYPDRCVPHPHIEDMIPCFGSFFIPIKDALESGEIDEVVNLTQRFLNHQSYSIFATAREIAEEAYCPDCGLFNECEC